MRTAFKVYLRELVPAQLQVPTKYWVDHARAFVEPEMSLLRHLVRRGDRVLDVGGNRGVYAYHCWRLGAFVDIFEPNPVCVRILNAWAMGKERVNLHAVALSDVSGAAQLHVPIDALGTEHDASASIEEHMFSNSRDQQISVRTLDSFKFSDIKFIKIDVEGHESKVIAGASVTLAKSRPSLLVEIEQRHLVSPIGEVFQQVEHYGYRGFFLDDGTLKPLVEFNADHHQNISGFANAGGLYINNFLFLNEARLQSGEYRSLQESLGA